MDRAARLASAPSPCQRGSRRILRQAPWKEPIRVAVYIQPRASKTELAGRHDGSIKIRIASPPVDNAANRVLIEFVAERLGIAKGKVRIVSGATSRRKVLEIEGATATAIAAAFPDP
jgi:uncharacterized protein (TIGR00251 family)